MNRYAKIAAELSEIKQELRRLAADTSPTKDGAKSLFEAYKKEHPGSKKTVKDFYDPKKSDKKKAPSKKVVAEVTSKLDEIYEKMTPGKDAIDHIVSPKVMKKLFSEIEKDIQKVGPPNPGDLDGVDMKKKSKPTRGDYDKVREGVRESTIKMIKSKIESINVINNDTLQKEMNSVSDQFSEALKGVTGDASDDEGIKNYSNEVSKTYKDMLTGSSATAKRNRAGIQSSLAKSMGSSGDIEKMADDYLSGSGKYGESRLEEATTEFVERNFDYFK
jgi:hypothetical protein